MSRQTNVPRVRFAPSPTGDLHVGNARTALFNWLFARHAGGRFALRIEDTDRDRNSDVFEQNILADLKWLNLDWDEGPDKGGPCGPYRQSERIEIYGSQLDRLRKKGLIYPCFCTEEELEAERASLISRRMTPRYLGKCRDLDEKTRGRLEAEGRKPAFRFRVGRGVVEFNDLIRGPMKFDCETIGDFIIVRSTGVPAYNFAVVVDDHLMEITHVIRGEDHLSNTALQMMLYGAFEYYRPTFAHHALILGKDHKKLAKRHGAVAVREFRAQGFLPEALINYLSLLGGSFADAREVRPVDEIIRGFSMDRVGKSGAIFDEGKLRWLNSIYIRNDQPEDFLARALPFLREAGLDCERADPAWLRAVLEAIRPNLATLADIGAYLDIFVEEKFRILPEAASILAGEESARVLAALFEVLGSVDVKSEELYQTVIDEVSKRTGLTGKKLLMPIRAAFTGRRKGPELEKIFAIVGRETLMKRLKKAVEK
ncbi:MAG: glutamate--tRNA ligase [Deltaproteobacteria bacterium]|nr:glutamate--tRNA ligase [Deltaproteobacteria bacterium]